MTSVIRRVSKKRDIARKVIKKYIKENKEFTSTDVVDHIVEQVGCSPSMAYSVLKEASRNDLILNIGKDPSKGLTDIYKRIENEKKI